MTRNATPAEHADHDHDLRKHVILPAMKSFHATLNLTFEAKDEQQALAIAQDAKVLLQDPHNFPWKVEVEIDDTEEN
jgi:hypothetical protein